MADNDFSLLFDGISRRATIPASASQAGPSVKNMSSFTWMAWIKPDPGMNQYQRLWVERQGTGKGIRFAATAFDDKLRFEFSPKDGVGDTNYDYRYVWDDYHHHVAFVINMANENSTYETYFDGALVAEGTVVLPSNVDREGDPVTGTPKVSNTWPQGNKVYVGNASYHTSGGEIFSDTTYWDGNVDDILLFDESKPQGDIVTYFSSHDIWDMSDSGMFSYWRFDEGTGTTSVDADNPSWVMTLSTASLWSADRPYIGNGNLDSTVPTTPGSPTTLLITPDGFTADWTASTDNVYVQFYEVDVAISNTFTTVLGTFNAGRITEYKVTGLNPSTNYYWRVRTLDAESNTSSYAATQSLTTSSEGDVTPPSPPTSPAAPLVNLGHSSFRLTWSASPSGDIDGYKVDIATDNSFENYVQDFRNRDVGNVLLFDIYGLSPLKTYYARIRGYDTAGLESIPSATLEVQTIPLPDLSPPLPVEMLPASSVTSKAATLNWEEGVDDVGISRYHLDVSADELFSTFVVAQAVTWDDINVGNVLSYRISELLPDTTYYYRVRAMDGAGNFSPDTDSMAFNTEPSAIGEGGFIHTILFPEQDAYVNSASSGTNYGTSEALEVLGSGAANVRNSYLQFNLAGISGTVVSAMLRLYVNTASSAATTINVDNVTFVESTVTYTTRPTITSANINFTPTTASDWVEIDISSLLTDGKVQYTVRLASLVAATLSLSSKEGLFAPQLVIESDPSTLTEVEPQLNFYDYNGVLTNLVKNPSFETNTTLWTGIGGTVATLSRLTDDGYRGTCCLQVVGSGASTAQGARYAINDATAAVGQWATATAYVKSVSGATALQMRISEYSSGGSLLASSTSNFTAVVGTWIRVSFDRTMSNASTAYVTVSIENAAATAATYKVDAVSLFVSSDFSIYFLPTFDGDTDHCQWEGTVHASRSKLSSSLVKMESNYTGDGDLDNVVTPFFRRRRETEWISTTLLTGKTTNDRGLKRVSSWVGPGYGVYNYVMNPSFELDLTHWSLTNPNSNASITRDTDVFTQGNAYDDGTASCRLTWGAGAGSGLKTTTLVPTSIGLTWNARAKVFIPVGVTIRLAIQFLNSGGTVLAEATAVPGTNQIVGAGEWAEITELHAAPSTTASVRVEIRAVSSGAQTAWVDTVLLSQTSQTTTNNPYRDGEMQDAFWEGNPHNSFTSIFLAPEVEYAWKHRYSDADGVLNALTDGYYHLNDVHTTIKVPDNLTTLADIELVSIHDTIYVTVPYEGDDNDNMTARIRWTRADLTDYTSVPVTYDRVNKKVTATIAGLKGGTSYIVRASLTDADGVYGPSVSGTTTTISETTTTTTTYDNVEVEPRIMFGGFVLMGREDGNIAVHEHDAFGLPDRRVQIEDLPRVDGAVELQNLWGRRKIRMSGFVAGESRAELEDNKNALKRALAPKLQRLVIDTLSNEHRYYYATVQSFAVAEKGGENIRHLTWDAEFVCADPFAYDATLSSIPEFLANDGNFVVVTNDGDLTADPIIKIRTTNSRAVTVSVMNTITGERITPDTTILSNDVLVIDTAKYSVVKNGVEVDYSGGFIHLAPGGNNIQFSLSSVLSNPSVRCTINWRARYL